MLVFHNKCGSVNVVHVHTFQGTGSNLQRKMNATTHPQTPHKTLHLSSDTRIKHAPQLDLHPLFFFF